MLIRVYKRRENNFQFYLFTFLDSIIQERKVLKSSFCCQHVCISKMKIYFDSGHFNIQILEKTNRYIENLRMVLTNKLLNCSLRKNCLISKISRKSFQFEIWNRMSFFKILWKNYHFQMWRGRLTESEYFWCLLF